MNDVKSGRREINAALTRAAVLDAARSLFVRRGFAATSVEDIARASRSSKGAVYHHFSDKQEIFAEVFATSQSDVIRAALEVMDGRDPAWERIETATRQLLRSYVADESARALLRQVLGVLGWERVRAIDEATALPLLRAMIEESIRCGDAVKSLPVETAAHLLFSLYCNAILFIAASSEPETAARESEQIIVAMLGGLRN